MFRLCSSTKVQEPTPSDEIVKQKAFSMECNIVYESSRDFNDNDLCKLNYLGPLEYSYNKLLYYFNEPQFFTNQYNMKQLVWYIKFNNGNVCSISKYYKYENCKPHLSNFKICGNNRSVLLDLAVILK